VYRSKIKTIFLAGCATAMAISIISFPQQSVEASVRGLNTWWQIVFPSLLPFFIVSELLIGFGVVRFIGVLLEPLMRPVFRVPGVGGFIWAMGMASGYPAGAKLTARLRQEGQLTRIEAERLVSFTNSSNPLFIFGAVSVGFYNNPNLGIILALSHYLGNICVGILMRFYGKTKEQKMGRKTHKSRLRLAFSLLHQTRISDNRPIGKLLGDAVLSSVNTLLMIGGFIILFSVVNKLLLQLQIIGFFSKFVEMVFSLFHYPESLSIPLLSGLFEITLGSRMTSEVKDATLIQQAMITSFILAFSGFSVQAQVASILAQTDIRFQPFFFARFFHGIFASMFTIFLWEPVFTQFYDTEQPSSALPSGGVIAENVFHQAIDIMAKIGPIITLFTLIAYIAIFSKRQTKRG
jgi:sporulation integral membrane protein YlbJ